MVQLSKRTFNKHNFDTIYRTHSQFTMTGSPDGDKCEQTLVIEGPGIMSWFAGEGYVDGKWTRSVSNACLVLQEGFPLKVFTTIDLNGYAGTPMDGVVKNLAFTNTATDTTVTNSCPAPPPECGCYAQDEEIPIENDQCVLALGSFPDVGGYWSLTYEMKILSLPAEPTDPRWFFEILSGIGSFVVEF